jgi:phospholipid N-methyltransferase
MMNAIEKQISSLQKKIDALSGDYLTNTWRRQQEQSRRCDKIDGYERDIALLELLNNKTHLGAFEQGLLNSVFRADIQVYSQQKNNVNFPEIDINGDYDSERILEVVKKQKRFMKYGIYTTKDLQGAIRLYKEYAAKSKSPVDTTAREIKTLEDKYRLKQKGDVNFTPKNVAQRLVELSKITSDSKVLEPSAGIGFIADEIKKVTPDLDCIELRYDFTELLELKGHKTTHGDFTEISLQNEYDAVIMNPPFSNNQDIEHLQKAYGAVKDGGILVCITSPHWQFAQDKKSAAFREWIETQDYAVENLESGTFVAAGVAGRIVVIYK